MNNISEFEVILDSSMLPEYHNGRRVMRITSVWFADKAPLIVDGPYPVIDDEIEVEPTIVIGSPN
jgi:hypothetical protein